MTSLPSRLHYLYEGEGGGKEEEEISDKRERMRFVYFCSACQCILNVSTELEPLDRTVEALENRCPGCAACLESCISCKAAANVPEAWLGMARDGGSTGGRRRRRRRPADVQEEMFRPAVTMRGFSFGFSPLDRLIGCIDPGWLTAFTGECTTSIAEFLCFRAQLPRTVGGLDSSVVLIDGGNCSDLYLFSSLAKLHGVPAIKALRRVVTSRSFTMYQLANLVTEGLPKVVDEYGAEMVIVSDILGMLDESELREEEARRVIDTIWSGISDVVKKKKVYGFTTFVTTNALHGEAKVADRADVLVNLDEVVNSRVRGTLVKHPFREAGSSSYSSVQFRLEEILGRRRQLSDVTRGSRHQ